MACYRQWKLRNGQLCSVADCDRPREAHGLCVACHQWQKNHGEIPSSADRRSLRPRYYSRTLEVDETTPLIYKTEIMGLDLTAADKKQVRILGSQQSQLFNVGIETAFEDIDAGIPIRSDWDASKEVLTPKRHSGELPSHNHQLQLAGLYRGLETARRHRSTIGKYQASIDRRSENIMKAKAKGNSKLLEKLERKQARTERDLAELRKDRKRFYRRRKAADNGKMPALEFFQGVKVSESHLRLPGGLKLKFRKQFVIPEGFEITGKAEIVDVTRKFTRRSEVRHRRFRAHIHLRGIAPVPPTPETKDDLLGIDLGIVIPVCTSAGRKIDLQDAELEAKSDAHIRYLDRCKSRHNPGSRRHKKLSHQRRKAWAKRTNRRKNASRHAAKQLTDHAQDQDCVMVVAEDLKHNSMRASARGTLEHPGVSVAAKRALNYLLNRAQMGRIQTDIERRCLLSGIGYIKVPPHGTSQHCNVCGTKGGRETQAVFLCSHCGWFGNADHNAALNICAKGWAAVRGQPSRDAPVSQTNEPTGQVVPGGSLRVETSSSQVVSGWVKQAEQLVLAL